MPLYFWQIAAVEKANAILMLEDITRKLGGPDVLGLVVRSQNDLALVVRQRLPLAALSALAKAGLSEQEIERYIIPQRTRRHRQQKSQPLTVDESDRAVRLVRVQTITEGTFGNVSMAATWLRRPLAALGNETPLEIAQTESGARVIETMLAKIAWGAAA
jgi:putative toxin-antitoxin system antitoxin component (TIGR02293 family)